MTSAGDRFDRYDRFGPGGGDPEAAWYPAPGEEPLPAPDPSYRDPRSLALRGVVAVLFGLLTLAWPGLTLTALVILWGAFALVDGVSTAVALLTRAPGTRQHRVLLAVHSIAGIAAGVVTFAWPAITALALLFVIAAWTLAVGVAEVATAVRFRSAIRHRWLLGLAGVLSVFVGLGLLAAPVAGALAITWLIGWWAIAFGVLSLSSAWQLHQRGTRSSTRHSSPRRIAPTA